MMQNNSALSFLNGASSRAPTNPPELETQKEIASDGTRPLEGYPLHPLEKQNEIIDLLSGKPVAAVSINHEPMSLS